MLRARKLQLLFALIFLLGVVVVIYIVNISLEDNGSENLSTTAPYKITFIE